MADLTDLVKRLRDAVAFGCDEDKLWPLVDETQVTIDALESELSRMKGYLSDAGYQTIQSEQAWRDRAEKAEADLAAARAVLRKSMEYLGMLHQFMCDAHKCDFNEDRTNSWIAYMDHEVRKFSHDENAIAAARAEKGGE